MINEIYIDNYEAINVDNTEAVRLRFINVEEPNIVDINYLSLILKDMHHTYLCCSSIYQFFACDCCMRIWNRIEHHIRRI